MTMPGTHSILDVHLRFAAITKKAAEKLCVKQVGMEEFHVNKMAALIASFRGRRSSYPQIEIYIWINRPPETVSRTPIIGLVFRNGRYVGHGLGDGPDDKLSSTERIFSRMVRGMMKPIIGMDIGKDRIAEILHAIRNIPPIGN